LSNTAKGRLPSKPLSYKHKDLCTKEEIMVDYLTGRLYVRLTSGEVIDITNIVLEDIRNFRTMDEYIYVHVPKKGNLITIKEAYANTIDYINKLFEKLGLVYDEDEDTYTIGIPNAYIVYEGVSETFNIKVSLSSNNYIKKSGSYYIYTIPVTKEAGYVITLNDQTDKIISKELDVIPSNSSSIEEEIENKNIQFMEYQSIAYTVVENGAICVFSDYQITSTMDITFTITRDD
jgi:hypothetical protein